MTKTFKEYKADADKQNAELKKNDYVIFFYHKNFYASINFSYGV